MSSPSAQTLYAAIDATWPAAAFHRNGPWTLRRGAGGGSRVSAATLQTEATVADIKAACDAMRDMDQTPIFMVQQGQDDLDTALAGQGLVIKDPVTLYSVGLDRCEWPKPPRMAGFAMWPPLAVCLDIWQAGGIGPERVAVMDRAATPKTALFGRAKDSPGGTAFVALKDGIAMLHALEVLARLRRHGLGRDLMYSAAHWARSQGATDLAVLVTTANEGANRLYRGLGMQAVGGYHYRTEP
ncbi:GNAT family N-acetyltransferase [Algirhabdus cladophorae]|uniref:GNAT family N-acetyltransferase n=1 Tax=Algirhabdus cladophorae TaxID=3377108 RepID=UPI003B8495BD